MRRPAARELYERLQERVNTACPHENERVEIQGLLTSLWTQLTEDDEPVFRSPLGAFRRIDHTPR